MRSSFVSLIVSLVVIAASGALSSQLRGLASGMAIPIALRSNLVSPDKTINFRALDSHIASVCAKITQGFENYKRNTGVRHPLDLTSLGKRANSIPLMDDNIQVWYGTISVGTPPESFSVSFDTGSADLFLPKSSCRTCNGHTLWDPASSDTAKHLSARYRLLYGDGTVVSLDLYNDTVSIADFTATTQTFGAALNYPGQLQYSEFVADGLMGLGFPSISGYNARPFFQTLITQGQVTVPVFSMSLEPSGGELFIGGENSALHTEEFTYVDVKVAGYWLVKMDNILGDGELLLSNIPAIIDTGSSLITGSDLEVKHLYAILGGSPAPSEGVGYYTFPCHAFPLVSLGFGGALFHIPAEVLNIGKVEGTTDCLSGIVGRDPTDHQRPFWVVGNVLLQTVYTTFDVENQRVGFAPLSTRSHTKDVG